MKRSRAAGSRLVAVIGLGANLGDRLASLRGAVRDLAELGTVAAVSRVYETAPVGPPQPDFLNAAALLHTERSPDALLDALLAIEQRRGRVRGQKWGPRVIDLDILWIEGVRSSSERLTVPHPQLPARAFALVPMLEVAPDAVDPSTGERYAGVPIDRSGVRTTDDRLLAEAFSG